MIKHKSVGGYFELELNNNSNYLHKSLIHLNTARNCFEYILKSRNYNKVYIPYFTCDVILEPLLKLNVEYEFYDVDNNLEPIFDYHIIKDNEGFLATNYFGIKTKFIKKLSSKINNLIIDNAQAFFADTLPNIDTFYSPRKFIGVSDGGLLSTEMFLNDNFDVDYSYNRFLHLLKRIDLSAEESYLDYKVNDKTLENQSIKWMSQLTKKVILNSNFDKIRKQRNENFNFLHYHLKFNNELNINKYKKDIPMVYPYKVKHANILRKKLLTNRIYCATYWPNVLDWCNYNLNSYSLTNEIIPLPIDQRYNNEDMMRILNLICK